MPERRCWGGGSLHWQGGSSQKSSHVTKYSPTCPYMDKPYTGVIRKGPAYVVYALCVKKKTETRMCLCKCFSLIAIVTVMVTSSLFGYVHAFVCLM